MSLRTLIARFLRRETAIEPDFWAMAKELKEGDDCLDCTRAALEQAYELGLDSGAQGAENSRLRKQLAERMKFTANDLALAEARADATVTALERNEAREEVARLKSKLERAEKLVEEWRTDSLLCNCCEANAGCANVLAAVLKDDQ